MVSVELTYFGGRLTLPGSGIVPDLITPTTKGPCMSSENDLAGGVDVTAEVDESYRDAEFLPPADANGNGVAAADRAETAPKPKRQRKSRAKPKSAPLNPDAASSPAPQDETPVPAVVPQQAPSKAKPKAKSKQALCETQAKYGRDLVQAFNQAGLVLRQIGDSTRIGILMLLMEFPSINVNDLCVKLGDKPQPAISHHLALLRHSGILWNVRRGKQVYYTLSEKGRHLAQTLQSYLA
jgi:DNA-binding transcriptional ArsR family regulator